MPALLARLAGYAGNLALLAALFFHWFGVPDARVENGATVIVTTEPRVTLLLKAACLLVVIAGAIMSRLGIASHRLAIMRTLLFVALLFFPCLVMTWSPAIAARASWLQTQHENLSWLGGDIYNEQEYKDIAWKSRVYVVDTERQVGVFRLPNWSPYMMQWGRLNDFMEWLGYSNRFCEFVCKGWFAALAGVALSIVPLCRGKDGLRYSVARTVGFTGVISLGAAITLALTPPMLSGFLLMISRHAAQRGDYESSLTWLQRAAIILPAIRQDTYFVTEHGLLDHRLGRQTPEEELYATTLLDRQGFDDEARGRYRALAANNPDGAVRREAVRGLLRMAINDLNSARGGEAAEAFQEVLSYEPCNLKALYAIQIAALRTGRRDLVRESAGRTLEIYERFNTLTKASIVAACNENIAYATFLDGDIDAALASRDRAIGRKK